MAAGLRAEVVQKVLDEGAERHSGEIVACLKEAIHSTRMDETSVSIRSEAAKRWGGEAVT
eukprot:CAMPEP_0172091664 /NCGR_PEP_ID=MMETSP1043-20130122/25024_1 /TAXON_ID=464988 /ORGANISM="Hemiselmis andersenii, Strain CCMP441" /LENGTH=59 /DNA_ID=CAMNT_0012754323 /DNA_START=31 /DNA_END=206 /DNA_ORIENTATION=-